MKTIALNKFNKTLQLMNLPIPQIGDDEILVKSLETGICSTDRELLSSQAIVTPDGDDNLIIGHEAVGKIIAIGASINFFKKGDIVVPTVRRGCGNCYFCQNEKSDMCTTGKYKERGIVGLQGFMSEYFSEKASNLVVVPSKLQKDAVLIEPTTVGIKSIYAGYEIQKARLYGGQNKTVNEIFKNILVIGGGSIGLLSSFILASLNTNVTCIDVDDEKGVKAEIIRDMGGQYLNLNEFKTESGINHSVFQSKSHKANFDLIIDASGNPDICFCFIDYLRPNSMLILLGLPGDRATVFSKYFDYSTFVLKNMIVLGSVNANKMHFEKTISHLMNLDSKYLNILNKIITHKLHYEQFEEAFALKTNERIKVVLTW